jgi:hypothetical protein
MDGFMEIDPIDRVLDQYVASGRGSGTIHIVGIDETGRPAKLMLVQPNTIDKLQGSPSEYAEQVDNSVTVALHQAQARIFVPVRMQGGRIDYASPSEAPEFGASRRAAFIARLTERLTQRSFAVTEG